jgi:hypothetical protein
VVNRPGDLDAKLQSLASELQLPPLSPLTLLKLQCKIQEGLDEHGTVGLIVVPPKAGEAMPAAILLIPVTDYNKFFEPFKVGKPDPGDVSAEEPVDEVHILDIKFATRNIAGYVAMTNWSNRAVLIKKNLKVAQKPAAALEPWRQWLAGKDVAAVILQPGLKTISTKGQEAIRAFQPIIQAQAGEQGKMAAGVFGMYAELLQAADKEFAAVGVALDLDKQNVLRLSKRLLLVPGGQCAQLIAPWHAPKENLLAGLPDEPFVAAGGGALSEAMYEQLMKLSFNMMKHMRDVYGLSDEQLEKLAKTQYQIQALKDTRSMSMLFGVGKSGQPMFSHTVMVMRVKDSHAYMKEYGKSIAEYNKIVNEAKSPMLPTIEVAPSKLGDTPALQVTIGMPQAATQAPEAAKAIQSMYGPGGKLVGWFAAADKQTVVFGYVDKKHVQQAIAAIKQGKPGLAGNAGVAKTAALLPSHAVMVAVLSPAGILAFVKRAAATVIPPEAQSNLKLPEFPKTPPIGMAVTTAPNELQACVVVPLEVTKAAAQYANKVRAGQGE